MAEPLVVLEGVTKSFGTEVVTEVLHGIDLEIRPAEFTALVGPSGSGKSTLLNLLGLLDRPTSGRILLAGRDTDRPVGRREERRAGADARLRLPVPPPAAGVHGPRERDDADARGAGDARRRGCASGPSSLLEEIGLADRAALHARRSSRAASSSASPWRGRSSSSPPLVLADEPTGNLDTESGAQVFELLRRVSAEHRTAFLVVTHDERIAARCDRILTMVDGRIRSDERNART